MNEWWAKIQESGEVGRLAKENRKLRERINEALTRMKEFTENDMDRSLLREILQAEEQE